MSQADTAPETPAPSRGRPPERRGIRRFWPAGLIALPFAEVAVTILLTRWLGGPIAFALYAIPAVIGLLVQWRRYPRMRRLSKLMADAGAEVRASALDPAKPQQVLSHEAAVGMWELFIYSLVLVLWLVPGVLSHLAALYLTLWPPPPYLGAQRDPAGSADPG